jgi:hypothetical protein
MSYFAQAIESAIIMTPVSRQANGDDVADLSDLLKRWAPRPPFAEMVDRITLIDQKNVLATAPIGAKPQWDQQGRVYCAFSSPR